MRCTSPRNVGRKADGCSIAFKPKEFSKEFAQHPFPCGQCIECRLQYAREWSIRCWHESKMHSESAFITLTYADEKLSSPKLVYKDFQDFMKRLRFAYPNREIGCFVTGEYGEKTKRPHWHALLFGFSPPDAKQSRQTDRGDQVFTSESLDKIWGFGRTEFGSVTVESAGYCARYASKKLVHGKDGEHEFEPISKKSNKYAIGKRWIEKYWRDVFTHGRVVLPDGTTIGVPRYYEKWLKENLPEEWLRYVTEVKLPKLSEISQKAHIENVEWWANHDRRLVENPWRRTPRTPAEVRKIISDSKFKTLQNYLKL